MCRLTTHNKANYLTRNITNQKKLSYPLHSRYRKYILASVCKTKRLVYGLQQLISWLMNLCKTLHRPYFGSLIKTAEGLRLSFPWIPHGHGKQKRAHPEQHYETLTNNSSGAKSSGSGTSSKTVLLRGQKEWKRGMQARYWMPHYCQIIIRSKSLKEKFHLSLEVWSCKFM